MIQEFYQAVLYEQTIHNIHPEYFSIDSSPYSSPFDLSTLPDPTPENFEKLISLLPKIGLDGYVPNLVNKQNKGKILERMRRAYGAGLAFLNVDEFGDCPQGACIKIFGSLSNPLSKYLYNFMIIKESNHKKYDPANETSGDCYRYRLNPVAMDLIARILLASGFSPKPIVVSSDKKGSTTVENAITSQYAFINEKLESGSIEEKKEAMRMASLIEEYGDEFLNGFKYNSTPNCSRLFHGCQNINKEFKHIFFSSMGYAFDYDVQSAAPTMLYEAAISVDPELAQKIPTIVNYIQNTKSVRNQISDECGVSYDLVKRIINARFAGAHLTVNREQSLFKLVNYNFDLMNKLKAHEFFINLAPELKLMWDKLRKSKKYGERFEQEGRLKSKSKWRFYFILETDFIQFVQRYCDDRYIRVFLEHDGFRTDTPIDLSQLQSEYRNYSGFNLKIIGSENNPYTINELEAKVKSLSYTKVVTMMDDTGLILNNTNINPNLNPNNKLVATYRINKLIKSSFKEEAKVELNKFLGELVSNIIDGKFKDYSSEDLIEELSNSIEFMGSSSTRRLLEDNKIPHASHIPIDSIVNMVVKSMKIQVPSMRQTVRTYRQKG